MKEANDRIFKVEHEERMKGSQLKTTLLVYCSVLCLSVTGCVSQKQLRTEWNQQLDSNLNSFVGKLTTDELLMFADSPTERIPVDDGEIWIYRYTATTPKTVTTEYSGNGSLLNPLTSVATEGGGSVYYWNIKFHFDKSHVLSSWSDEGSPSYVLGSAKFKEHKCK